MLDSARRLPRRGMRFIIVAAGLSLLLPPLAALAAPRLAVNLGLSPSSGPAGSSVTASGSGWTPSPSNPPYIIFWETKGGATLGNFSPNGSGNWSKGITIPGGASPGAHTVIACEGYGEEFEGCASATFTVVSPSDTPTPPPTRTPTRPPTATRVPTNTSTPTATVPPTACGDLGLGPEAEVMTFDEPFAGTSTVSFGFSAVVEAPAHVHAHSGTQAARSQVAMEFGSALLPITMVFNPIGATAVGMFVGLDTTDYVTSDVTATLQAYGYRAGSDAFQALGSSAVTFPPAPTDIQHCLVFHAAEGETIARVEIEYTTEGTTMADARWIDDATFVWAAEPLPEDDQPPVVEITQPEERSVLVGGSVDVRATIAEDRNLERVWYRINGGPEQALGYSGFVGDPTHYQTFFGVSPLALTPYSDNTIELFARDAAGLEGSDHVVVTYVPPTPTPSLDIYVSRFEITQAIQCMQNPRCGSDNSIPIYTGKPTLIRLYAAANASAPGISGRLCHAGECIASLNRITVDASDDPVADFRSDLTKTLNFLVPSGWIARGRVDITVEVNPDLADAPECCRDNNSQNYFFTVTASKRLDVKMMRVRAFGITPPGDARWTAYDYLRMVYPTGDIHLWTLTGDRPFDATYDYTDSAETGCGDGWDGLLDDLWWHNFWNDDPVDWYRYYGMLDDQVPHNYSGCGYRPGDEAGGVVQTEALSFADWAGMVAAQEIGHNHGRRHAPGCGAAGADGSYPAGDDAFGDAGVGITGEWGIDLRSMTLKPPDQSFDFMGYCGGPAIWVGPYTYRAIGSALRRVAFELPGQGMLMSVRPQPAASEYLVGSLRVEGDTATLTRGFVRQPLPSDVQLPDGTSGKYAVDLLDAGGVSRMQRFFDPTELSNADEATADVVRVFIPWVDGTVAIALSRDGRVLLNVPVSPGTPSVQLTSPNGGESWGGTGNRRIEWQASDADGDPLDYTLQLSLDGGQTWSALAIGLTEASYEVEAAEIGGSDHARIRVVASDGVNTASDESDADFSIGKKGPQLSLLSPRDGQTFGRGDEVILEGAAVDYEDGTIADESLVWTSDRDGELGRGRSLWGLTLSQGVHRIALAATDRDGMTTSQTVRITVGEAGQAARPSSLAAAFWLAGLFLVALAGIGLLVYALRGRSLRR